MKDTKKIAELRAALEEGARVIQQRNYRIASLTSELVTTTNQLRDLTMGREQFLRNFSELVRATRNIENLAQQAGVGY